MSRKKKLVKKILDALREPAPLNNNPGPLEPTPYKFASKKDRRHDGRKEAPLVKHGGMKFKEAHAEAIDPVEYWDDWTDWRDGFRDRPEQDPEEIKKQVAIRKARRQKK